MSKAEAHVVASNSLLASGFVPAFFPDCQWCVLSPWIATLDGKPYRLHCANDLAEAEARSIAEQLEQYAKRNANTSVTVPPLAADTADELVGRQN